MRLLAPAVVRWEPGGARAIDLSLVNVGDVPVGIPSAPGPFVAVSVAPAGARAVEVCRRRATEDAAPAPNVTLEPGGRTRFTIDLSVACATLGPDDYRFTAIWKGPLRGREVSLPASGRLVLREPDAVLIPRRPMAVSPPEHASPPIGGLEDPLAGVTPPGPTPDRAPGGAALAACVDSQLARQGRNAYGDPPATAYPDGPPVAESERIEYVLERLPQIRTTCSEAGGW